MNKISVLLTILSCLCVSSAALCADDVAEILAQHEKILQAHRDNDVDLLMEDAADKYTLVTGGEVIYPSIEERSARFVDYFGITEFSKYEDSIPPVVKVSDDGTLAWLIARVSVSGTQHFGKQEQALEFVSAWIELYEKKEGRWIQTGNVSNFKQ